MDNKTEKTMVPYFETDEKKGSVIFVNPVKCIRKTIVEDHILLEKEVDNYSVISKYACDSSLYSGKFTYGSYCCSSYGEGHSGFILWRIQPDGRYYSDEDGFGCEDQDEIELYLYVDDEGNCIGNFRIYSIGCVKYYRTALEDEEAEYDRKRGELREADIDDEKSRVQIMADRIRKALNSIQKQLSSGVTKGVKASFITEYADYDCCLSVRISDDACSDRYRLSAEIYIEPHRLRSVSLGVGSRSSEKLFRKWLKNTDCIEAVQETLERLYYDR